jgi:hypothetical protein
MGCLGFFIISIIWLRHIFQLILKFFDLIMAEKYDNNEFREYSQTYGLYHETTYSQTP